MALTIIIGDLYAWPLGMGNANSRGMRNNTLPAADKYIIHSRAEKGFWNNDMGWVYDVTSATTFDSTDFNLPLASENDAEWMVHTYGE